MVFAGSAMIFLALYGTYISLRNRLEGKTFYLKLMFWAIALPYIANTAGWIMTEVGRQPWIVFGLQKTVDGVSPTVSSGMVLTSLIGFTAIYGILAIVLLFLFIRVIRQGPEIASVHGETATHAPMLYDQEKGKGADVHV